MAKLIIRYKSGRQVKVRVDSFNITRTISGSINLEWKNMKPRPLLIGVDEIESIWEA